MKKLVIFDFDGTLVDTITDAGRCFNKTLEHYGFNTYPLSDYPQIVGGDLEVIFSKLLPKDKVNDEIVTKLKDKYKEIYVNDEKPNTKPFEGIVELLLKLKLLGIKLAINTNKSQVLTELLCEKFFSEVEFDAVRGYVEGRPSKPNPASVHEIMDISGVSIGDTVYIGDGNTDIRTAENAGVDCVFVLWGQGKSDLKYDRAVTYVAESIQDLEKALGGLSFEKN